MITNIYCVRKDGEVYQTDTNNVFITNKPDIPMNERETETVKPLGRNSSVTYDYGTYKNRTITIPFVTKKYNDFYKFCSFFNGTKINMYPSWQNGLYYKVLSYSINLHDAKGIPEFDVNFLLEPFMYGEEEKITNSTFENQGDVNSKMKIKIFGSGNLQFNFNGKSYQVNNVTNYVTIDSELKECYKDGENKGNDFIGDIEELEVIPGTNIFTNGLGNITKFEITYVPVYFR